MASDRDTSGGPLPLHLLEDGDPAFVDALRAVDDADALADFAAGWADDRRPGSRRLLLDYLDRPLNAYRHEGLIKRLFKRGEAAGDDEVMARFLVLFDRSVRRAMRTRSRRISREVETAEEGRALELQWAEAGYRSISQWETNLGRSILGDRPDPILQHPPRSTMPRGRMVKIGRGTSPPAEGLVPDWAVLFGVEWDGQSDIHAVPGVAQELERLRLFTVATRSYLRRRAWRYFRKLGKEHPGRYVAAASAALALYRDEDVADGLALIDNWGLVHLLFHHSPALEARPTGWYPRPGRPPGELAPAPIYESLWAEAPAAVVGLLAAARCRTVRHWAIRRVEADPERSLAALPAEGWVDVLGHDDPEVVALAARLLRGAEGLGAIEPARWLALAESASPPALDVICELVARHVGADRVTTGQAVRLAGLHPWPPARLGLDWLKAEGPRGAEADRPVLLGLLDAECGPLRPEILGWLRSVLADPAAGRPGAILEFLDSRHADARAEGWAWFLAEPRARDDRETWARLLESPHDDIRLALVAELESRLAAAGKPGREDLARTLDPEAIRDLWASVLLNVHRGSRAKPAVVRQILRRLEARPADAPALLPLLGVALRSVRGPERRAGLVAVVQLVESRAEVGPLVRAAFPELQWA